MTLIRIGFVFIVLAAICSLTLLAIVRLVLAETSGEICLEESSLVVTRRYDVEEEAKKLFDDNLEAVLRNFRKTPEYVTILNNRLKSIKDEFKYIYSYFYDIYSNKAINATLWKFGVAREEDTDNNPSNSTFRSKIPNSHDKVDFSNTNMTSREYLESKVTFNHHQYKPKEINTMKNEAFKYAGFMIHECMRALSNEVPGQSTRQPAGGDEIIEPVHPEEHTPAPDDDQNPHT